MTEKEKASVDSKTSAKKTLTREQIDKKYKWNIEAMYPDEAKWDEDFEKALDMAKDYSRFAGHLTDSAATLLSAYKERDNIWQLIEHIYVYARMRRDEDNTVTKYQAMSDKCNGLISKASAVMSFFTPELLAAPEEKILGFIESEPGLKTYEFAIREALRSKEHILSETEENLIAQFSEITSATNDIFTMLNNADMKFGEIEDEDGDMVELTHGKYIGFLESKDRRVRKDAFEHLYNAYISHINTIATTYNYNTKSDVVGARIRKYPSSLEAALHGDNIPTAVYANLIDVVNKALPTLHKYIGTRKRLMGVDELHMYDIYMPLTEMPKTHTSFEEALDIMRESLSVLGDDYISKMNEGIASGWIDVYENTGKTSGAYSFGCYDSMPYMMMNFQDKLKDVFTLVHEMGHSMHSRYTREAQPYIYGGHSIFTAEVASTVNENLLIKHLLKKQEEKLAASGGRDKDALLMKKYLLNLYIEEFRATLFRQTMFAEFEKITHEAAETAEVLTAEWMCEQYEALNRKYFGPDVICDNEIRYEWARIPHFYNAFYVYKYATGYSAAAAISDLILNEGGRDNYIEFLKTGESNHPIELLKIAGVDMSKPEPIEKAMRTFARLVDEFDELTR